MAQALPGASPLLNWTQRLEPLVQRLPSDTFTIAYVGRISVDKGIDVLAEAVALLTRSADGERRVRLLIAGDDRFVPEPQRRRVHAALRQPGLEVELLGWVSPLEAYSRADVCAFPSRWFEPFGLVVAEAMALGIPVVVSDAGALPEVVGADHPWVFPNGSASALAAMLTGLYAGVDRDPVIRARARCDGKFFV
jgi:glycosyltransferase involved in cell wall biosynthesis